MEYLDARRLTGPSLLWDRPGSVLDVKCTVVEAEQLIPVWERHVRRMLMAVGWSSEQTCWRQLSNGVSLAISAPIDALYAATEINEWAWTSSEAELTSGEISGFTDATARIKAAIQEQTNPALLALGLAATGNDVAFLWDDDQVSVGLGKGSETWPFRRLPDSRDLDWSQYHNVPVALVTGTNGKTTSVRLAQHILRGCGQNVGLSSTDWIAVNERIIDRGDWSGPGGARKVLRENDVDVAILESARGGLLRRGLGVNAADAALITNVAEDHLGDFGSQNVHELLNVKWIVSRAVEKSGALILNADDALLVAKSAEFGGNIVWFSLDARNAVIDLHVRNGGLAFVLDGGDLLRVHGNQQQLICASQDIPITLAGAASHNVANSLAAAALTDRLGASVADIRRGLVSMSQHDNPGRCNVYSIDGFRVLVDFAHNPHAMQALFEMASALPAKRRLLAFGQAGDRTNASIRELAKSAWAIGLDAVIVSELASYARGRAPGEVYSIIRDELVGCGADSGQILHFVEEMDSFNAALEWASEGDLIIMLALGGSKAITEKLTALAAASA